MQPTQQLIDDLYRERVLRARRTTPEEKLLDGAILFTEVCERMQAGIRLQFPDADDADVDRILQQRIRRLRQIEEDGIYSPWESADE